MNTLKTTRLTLKRIVEAVQDGSLPDNGFGEKPAPMTADKKKKLMELAAMYEKFGECLNNEESLMNSAKGLTELCELAETYAVNECGEWFQKQIVDKDMKELKRRVGEFQKVVQETYARMQQAGVAYQDIGHILGRYYDLKGNKGMDQDYQQVPGPQPLQETDAPTLAGRTCDHCGKGKYGVNRNGRFVCSVCNYMPLNQQLGISETRLKKK